MHKHTIIECQVSDDADYEWLYDQAIVNTLADYFALSEDMGIDTSFTKRYEDNLVHGLTLLVDAEFENKSDYATFKLACGKDLPYGRYEMKQERFI